MVLGWKRPGRVGRRRIQAKGRSNERLFSRLIISKVLTNMTICGKLSDEVEV